MATHEMVNAHDSYQEQRLNMVQTQIIARGISDKHLIKAMQSIPRHEFVPHELVNFAYSDSALPLNEENHDETISQPYIVAYMIEVAQIKSTDKILEIGTGSGYNAALLSKIGKEVYTIEINPILTQKASNILKRLGYSHIHLKIGDGAQGWEEAAPFDVILVTASTEKIPPKLIEQLKIGGSIIIPIRNDSKQELAKIKKTKTGIKLEKLIPVRFVPLK